MARKLIVEIIGDSSSLSRSLNKSTTDLQRFDKQSTGALASVDKGFTKLQKVAAGGFLGGAAATAIASQGKAAIDVASNLNEQLDRNAVVFGASADAVEDWSKRTASSIGIAQDQALEAVGTFGAMFDQAGKSSADAAELSQAIVTLASDLASFNNANIDETLIALRSGLSGEIEPLRRFQVFLTEAAVSARAMEDANKSSVDQLTQGEKIIARYNLIMEQTVKQQGNYADTADSLANTQRRLSAETRDLQASIGGLLLPTVTELVTAMADATGGALDLLNAIKGLGKVKVPVIEIPISTVFRAGPGGGIANIAKEIIKHNPLNPLSFVFNAQALANLFRENAKKVDTSKLAEQFDDQFAPFTSGLVKGAEKARKRLDTAAKGVASFGEKGFKPLAKSLANLRQEAVEADLTKLGLGLDRAQIDDNLSNDVAALEALADGYRRAIAAGVDVAENQVNLARTIGDIADTRQQMQDDADDAFLGRLSLAIDRARLTPSLNNDIAALEGYAAGLRKLIAQGRNVTENERDLSSTMIELRDARAERAKNQREAALAAATGQQFRALGLDALGEEFVPTGKNLLAQFKALTERLGDEGVTLGSKMSKRFEQIGKLLGTNLKKLTPEVRSFIREFFGEVRDEFDKESTAPLTKTTSLNANKVLEGLGLGRDAEKELRARLSSFNSAGLSLAGATRPTGNFNPSAPVIVESHTTVNLDGETVGRNVTRQQQKRARRNPVQKRGPNSGI